MPGATAASADGSAVTPEPISLSPYVGTTGQPAAAARSTSAGGMAPPPSSTARSAGGRRAHRRQASSNRTSCAGTSETWLGAGVATQRRKQRRRILRCHEPYGHPLRDRAPQDPEPRNVGEPQRQRPARRPAAARRARRSRLRPSRAPRARRPSAGRSCPTSGRRRPAPPDRDPAPPKPGRPPLNRRGPAQRPSRQHQRRHHDVDGGRALAVREAGRQRHATAPARRIPRIAAMLSGAASATNATRAPATSPRSPTMLGDRRSPTRRAPTHDTMRSSRARWPAHRPHRARGPRPAGRRTRHRLTCRATRYRSTAASSTAIPSAFEPGPAGTHMRPSLMRSGSTSRSSSRRSAVARPWSRSAAGQPGRSENWDTHDAQASAAARPTPVSNSDVTTTGTPRAVASASIRATAITPPTRAGFTTSTSAASWSSRMRGRLDRRHRLVGGDRHAHPSPETGHALEIRGRHRLLHVLQLERVQRSQGRLCLCRVPRPVGVQAERHAVAHGRTHGRDAGDDVGRAVRRGHLELEGPEALGDAPRGLLGGSLAIRRADRRVDADPCGPGHGVRPAREPAPLRAATRARPGAPSASSAAVVGIRSASNISRTSSSRPGAAAGSSRTASPHPTAPSSPVIRTSHESRAVHVRVAVTNGARNGTRTRMTSNDAIRTILR